MSTSLNLMETTDEKKVYQIRIVGHSKNSWSGVFKNVSVLKSRRR